VEGEFCELRTNGVLRSTPTHDVCDVWVEIA
jgi:hypothetical protein